MKDRFVITLARYHQSEAWGMNLIVDAHNGLLLVGRIRRNGWLENCNLERVYAGEDIVLVGDFIVAVNGTSDIEAMKSELVYANVIELLIQPQSSGVVSSNAKCSHMNLPEDDIFGVSEGWV